MSALIGFFDDGVAPEHALLGGKCASLVALTAAGMAVPPGFTVTTAAYELFLAESGIAPVIADGLADLDADDVNAVDTVSAGIRSAICEREISAVIIDAVTDAFAALQARADQPFPVAVRSSATAEDLPDASFAGQQDTFLWLNDLDQVAEHIRRCWASLYTSRAIVYRLKNGIPDEGLSMAVAVQKMVNARAAGVAMTMDPTNGDRSTITIDASWGVGELVVSGQVTPDNIRVDKVMIAIVDETIGAKHIELVPAAGRLVERAVADERRAVRCLSDDEVLAVAAIAKRAEKHFGAPQDIEWAIDADLPDGENLVLLQSRPETVWSQRASSAGLVHGSGIDSITRSLMAQIGR
jgi:pyruvate,water dikinase